MSRSEHNQPNPSATTDDSALWFTAEQLAARYQTTHRTILRWVAEGRIPKPRKFGKLARWSRSLIEELDAEGVARPTAHGNELDRIAPMGFVVTCPCCGEPIRVKRDGTAEPVKPARSAGTTPAKSSGTMPKTTRTKKPKQ